VDPRRAVALTGMADAAPVLGLLDGSRDRAQVVAAAAELGIPEAVTDRVLTLLAAGGALDDFPVAVLRTLPPEQRRRLAAELAATALARGHSDGGAAALARRDAAWVQVYGPDGLPALRGPDPDGVRPGLAADPGPAGGAGQRSSGVRHGAGRRGGRAGRRSGPGIPGSGRGRSSGGKRDAGAGPARLAVAPADLAATPGVRM
jgi:hypothetical protein